MNKDEKKPVEKQENDEFSSIPKSVLNLLTKFATEKAIEVFNRQVMELRTRRKDYRMKNTRLLLKKYRWFKGFTGNAVSDLTQLLSEEEVVWLESMGMENMETRRVESIKDRVVFTNTVMGHINTMLDVYKKRCTESDREDVKRRWRVLEAMYLSEEVSTAEEIAEREYINVRTIFKDLNAAVAELSGLFFGIDLSDLFGL